MLTLKNTNQLLGRLSKSRSSHIPQKKDVLQQTLGLLLLDLQKSNTPNPKRANSPKAPPIGARLGRLGICRLALRTPHHHHHRRRRGRPFFFGRGGY